jgi:hypothetical protein
VLLDYDLENTPLEIRTDSEVGSNEKMEVVFHTAQGSHAGSFRIWFMSTVQYHLGKCSSSWTDFPSSLPSSKEKLWKITLSRATDIRIQIHCNGVEVLNQLMSYTTCGESSWVWTWNKDVEKIAFTSRDTASDDYRPYTGDWKSISDKVQPL